MRDPGNEASNSFSFPGQCHLGAVSGMVLNGKELDLNPAYFTLSL